MLTKQPPETMDDTDYMQRALDLAAKGIGWVEPNPAVGCVIVKDGRVIGEGFHERFGGPHAEINALADCRQRGIDPAGAAMIVTLEPCCHVGKTGPCTEAVIAAGIAKVVIATGDPFHQVAGGGIERLRNAGIDVETGPGREQALVLNAPFFKYARTKRPWVIAKWAQSADAFLASRRHRWISCETSRRDVHRLRRRCQGILVGVQTAIADDPRLTVRIADVAWERQPLRIILDSTLRIPDDKRVLDTAEAATLVVITSGTLQKQSRRVAAMAGRGVEILAVAENKGRCDLNQVLEQLGRRGIQQLLVEGGPAVLTDFLRQDLVDEVRIYLAPTELASEGAVRVTETMASFVKNPEQLLHGTTSNLDCDRCIAGLIHEPPGE
ncbi:MAG: bifunctional diaminohydroxyphosphoribosylaminopyrimidine deaminase/5-amino-6-(5-phosphoribosylamino)uracil reductase RibD [Phycisphaerae bacterium]|nr:bifunctional diaminohydroxyphosphoribosylaminopyrimidine deaminase/5-amino-6-(5-phosphoribosylamino)uracil reductase RibD [Phycisphaerae bacterium]